MKGINGIFQKGNLNFYVRKIQHFDPCIFFLSCGFFQGVFLHRVFFSSFANRF